MTIHDPSLRLALKTLKLTGMLDTLDARLAQTRDGKLGHLEFLQVLCEDEIARRETAALARRVRRARFEQPNTFEDFDFTVSPKLPAAMLRDLSALRWLEAGESVILYGPTVIEGSIAKWLCLRCSGRCCDRCNVGRWMDAATGQFAS